MFKHVIYELKLHCKLVSLLATRSLKLLENKEIPQEDILTIIIEMQRKYLKEKRNITKDITYALSTAILISELALQFSSLKYNVDKLRPSAIFELHA